MSGIPTIKPHKSGRRGGGTCWPTLLWRFTHIDLKAGLHILVYHSMPVYILPCRPLIYHTLSLVSYLV